MSHHAIRIVHLLVTSDFVYEREIYLSKVDKYLSKLSGKASVNNLIYCTDRTRKGELRKRTQSHPRDEQKKKEKKSHFECISLSQLNKSIVSFLL